MVGALSLAACATRPSVEELQDSIMRAVPAEDAFVDDAEARCMAAFLVDGPLSDTTLAGLAESFDNAEVLSSEADLVADAVREAALSCGVGGLVE